MSDDWPARGHPQFRTIRGDHWRVLTTPADPYTVPTLAEWTAEADRIAANAKRRDRVHGYYVVVFGNLGGAEPAQVAFWGPGYMEEVAEWWLAGSGLAEGKEPLWVGERVLEGRWPGGQQ